MTKKQSSASASKAVKKVKAAQKVERKETKKVLKAKSTSGVNTPLKGKGKSKKKKANDSDTDDDDLEGILERVSLQGCTRLQSIMITAMSLVDAEGMGGGPYGHRGACRRPPESTSECHADSVSKRKSPLVHWRRIFQRGWTSSV